MAQVMALWQEEIVIRTQIQLTENQARALKDLAPREGKSVAELTRQAIDHWLRTVSPVSPDERRRRAITAAQGFHSGVTDLSEHHDDYLLTETTAVAQRHLGFDAVTALYADILPVLHVEWIDPALHQAAAAVLMTIRQRHLSLVDCTSFELMRRLGLRQAFTFDRHFAEQGFACLP